jgi:hypothetical protein
MSLSASAVGLARRGVIPRKQFYTELFFSGIVILVTKSPGELTGINHGSQE